ncbi:MAG: PBECR4 domain-containing protein [Clostridiales bacterium]|nr:PBECR4 domain-containing protein [Clostridiales bacterium]
MRYNRNGEAIYTKQEAAQIIVNGAKLFKKNLCDNDLLFIGIRNFDINCYKVGFRSWCYLHFTGVSTSLKAQKFYEKAINNTLSADEFEFVNKFTTFKKLSVLTQAMSIQYQATSIGSFTNQGIFIKADVGVGNTTYAMTMGQTKSSNYYPIGLLQGDIRKFIYGRNEIVTVLSKSYREKKFNNITYKSKSVNVEKRHFPEDIRKLVTDEALLQIKPNIDLSKKAEG